MIDLYELSKEYLDLYDRDESDDPDDALDNDEKEYFEQLKQLNSELNDALWVPNNLPFVIAESEFVQYVEESAYDLGYLARDSEIAMYVDWKQMAEDWQSDYSTFEWEGETYYWQAT